MRSPRTSTVLKVDQDEGSCGGGHKGTAMSELQRLCTCWDSFPTLTLPDRPPGRRRHRAAHNAEYGRVAGRWPGAVRRRYERLSHPDDGRRRQGRRPPVSPISISKSYGATLSACLGYMPILQLAMVLLMSDPRGIPRLSLPTPASGSGTTESRHGWQRMLAGAQPRCRASLRKSRGTGCVKRAAGSIEVRATTVRDSREPCYCGTLRPASPRCQW